MIIDVKVFAREGAYKLLEIGDQTLRLRIGKKPIDGEANKALIEYLAKLLKVPKSSITLLYGKSSSQKRLEIAGIEWDEARERLAPHLQS